MRTPYVRKIGEKEKVVKAKARVEKVVEKARIRIRIEEKIGTPIKGEIGTLNKLPRVVVIKADHVMALVGDLPRNLQDEDLDPAPVLHVAIWASICTKTLSIALSGWVTQKIANNGRSL